MKNCSSSKAIFHIVDTCNKSLWILNSLKLIQNALVDNMAIYTIVQKLSDNLKERWEQSLNHNNKPSVTELQGFLDIPAESLLTLGKPTKTDARKINYSRDSSDRLNVHKNLEKSKCCLLWLPCHTHLQKINDYACRQQIENIQLNKLSINWLCRRHFTNKCASKLHCISWYRRHHTLLHNYYVQGNEKQQFPII